MSVHIGAKQNEIAKTVLMPGDPLRAKFIAETMLEDAVCYNTVRGMYGYTGTYKGKKVSVQGSGMGMPSMSIYAEELFRDYGVENIIRIGTCGTIQEDIQVRDVIIAMSASTDSNINNIRFGNANFAPTASFDLVYRAYQIAQEKNMKVAVGNVLSADLFYHEDPEAWKIWAKYNVLALEMEGAALYTLAAKYRRKALMLLTVSDNIITGEETTSEERQTTFTQMIELALETAEA
ncbi:purine-nucleoside phosphorylase [Clostridium collagenovorans DSM 3089]|uniref:Purine nucleoside phosphorylase DeoD-type n=1 Tax=Clostridium collagenovorans DSM 3089 TaxID=1121306 RepID=A0A1M5XJE5_9CLOT|nr:purine-nucleoside phosphorylase [Clostridium collagenovorans]SHH99957.1 purine-nucleoside phosphorylase [Clostridium collagenovorans DSM 3089]